MFTQNVMLLACLELPWKFLVVVGWWWLKATLVFCFGPNWTCTRNWTKLNKNYSFIAKNFQLKFNFPPIPLLNIFYCQADEQEEGFGINCLKEYYWTHRILEKSLRPICLLTFILKLWRNPMEGASCCFKKDNLYLFYT